MYTVKIRDHVMIAHSLKHPGFGVASHMHGATYIIDACFTSIQLNEMNVVIDIALAHKILKDVVSSLNFKNLDELPQFKEKITTTEFMANYIHKEIAKHPELKFDGQLEVTLGESHIAWASYTGPV
jgi:6-pyruvoyltetrahydropterin/6-carboxytetrahydropterin synthase